MALEPPRNDDLAVIFIEIEKICIDGLRKLNVHSDGVVKFLISLTLPWLLDCFTCRVIDQSFKQKLKIESSKLKNSEEPPVSLDLLPLLWYWTRRAPDYYDALVCLLIHNIYSALESQLKPGKAAAAPNPKIVIERFIVQKAFEIKDVEVALEKLLSILNSSDDSL